MDRRWLRCEDKPELRHTAHVWLLEVRTFFTDLCTWATEPDSPFGPHAPRVVPLMRRDLAQLGEIIGCIPMPGGHFAAKPPTELAVLGAYSALPEIVVAAAACIIVRAACSEPPGPLKSTFTV